MKDKVLLNDTWVHPEAKLNAKPRAKANASPPKGGRGHIREIDVEEAIDPYAGWDYYHETQDEQWEYDPAEEEWEEDTPASSGGIPPSA